MKLCCIDVTHISVLIPAILPFQRRRGIAIAAEQDRDDIHQEVMWEISPDRGAPLRTGLPPLPPVGSAKGLGLAAGYSMTFTDSIS